MVYEEPKVMLKDIRARGWGRGGGVGLWDRLYKSESLGLE